MKYAEIPLESSYRLVNHGPLVLISTRMEDGQYNIAPVAWNCPVGKTPPRLLAAVGKSNATCENILRNKEFIICVPCRNQSDLVKQSGAVSGRDSDKFEDFNIEFIMGSKTDARIPEGCTGYIECSLTETFDIGNVVLFIGEAVAAGADPEGFSERVRPESEVGKTLHHLGGNVFGILSVETGGQ